MNEQRKNPDKPDGFERFVRLARIAERSGAAAATALPSAWRSSTMRTIRLAAVEEDVRQSFEIRRLWRVSGATVACALAIHAVYFFSPLHHETELASAFGGAPFGFIESGD